jgi:hypothetical protein
LAKPTLAAPKIYEQFIFVAPQTNLEIFTSGNTLACRQWKHPTETFRDSDGTGISKRAWEPEAKKATFL